MPSGPKKRVPKRANSTPGRAQARTIKAKQLPEADSESRSSGGDLDLGENDQDLEIERPRMAEQQAKERDEAEREDRNATRKIHRDIKRSIRDTINEHEIECLDASNPQKAAIWLMRLNTIAAEAYITANFEGNRKGSDSEWEARETSAMNFLCQTKLVGVTTAETLFTMRTSEGAGAAQLYKHIVRSIRGADSSTPDQIKQMMKVPILPDETLGEHTNRFKTLNSRFTIANAGKLMNGHELKMIFLYTLNRHQTLRDYAVNQITQLNREKEGSETEASFDTIVQQAHAALLSYAKYAQTSPSSGSGESQEMGLLTREFAPRAASTREDGKAITRAPPEVPCSFRNTCGFNTHPTGYICPREPNFLEKIRARRGGAGRSTPHTAPVRAGQAREECRRFRAGRCSNAACSYAHSTGGGRTNSAYSVMTQSAENELRAQLAAATTQLATLHQHNAHMARMLPPPAVQGEYGLATRGHFHNPHQTRHAITPGPRKDFDTFGQGRPQE